jgi:hypothetical protein
MARELPGKLACVYGYGVKSGVPPRNIAVHSNLCVIITAPLIDGGRAVDDWLAAGVRHLGLYDYVLSSRSIVPLHVPHVFGRAWKAMFRKHDIAFLHNELSLVSWHYDGPRQYVFDHLAWNMEADIDALLDEYFNDFYGEAAGPMRRFFDRIEAIHLRKEDPFHLLESSRSPQRLDGFARDDLAFLDDCLLEARAAAAGSVIQRRVRLFARLWGYSRLEVLARICTRELEALSPGEPDRMLAVAREACDALAEKDGCTLSEEDEKALLTSRMTFAEYKTILQQEPYVETAVDAAFDRWREVREADSARAFFSELAKEDGRIGQLARTQVYLTQNVPADVARNGGFESAARAQPGPEEQAIRQRFDWKDFKADAWGTWHFQRSNAAFAWDEKEVHSGRRSVAISGAELSACFQQAIPVSPGERYRVSVWVKQRPAQPQARALTVRWVGEGGWRDEGGKPGQAPPFSVDLPLGAADWTPLAGSFTVPDAVTKAVVLLGAARQDPDAGMWFDDLRFEKILPLEHRAE